MPYAFVPIMVGVVGVRPCGLSSVGVVPTGSFCPVGCSSKPLSLKKKKPNQGVIFDRSQRVHVVLKASVDVGGLASKLVLPDRKHPRVLDRDLLGSSRNPPVAGDDDVTAPL